MMVLGIGQLGTSDGVLGGIGVVVTWVTDKLLCCFVLLYMFRWHLVG